MKTQLSNFELWKIYDEANSRAKDRSLDVDARLRSLRTVGICARVIRQRGYASFDQFEQPTNTEGKHETLSI